VSDHKPRIRDFIESNFLIQATMRLQDSDSLLDFQIVDSTGFLELIHFVESEFGLKVPDAEMVLENFESIDAIAQYVQRKLGA